MSLDHGRSTTFDTHLTLLGADKYGLENIRNHSTIPPRGATAYVGLIPWEIRLRRPLPGDRPLVEGTLARYARAGSFTFVRRLLLDERSTCSLPRRGVVRVHARPLATHSLPKIVLLQAVEMKAPTRRRPRGPTLSWERGRRRPPGSA